VDDGAARDLVAVAAIVHDGRLLLGHRHPGRRWYPDVWDLIGGHIEPGESPADAVRRECREELAVTICQPHPIEIPFESQDVVLRGFLVTDWDGDPINAAPEEHDALAWFTANELAAHRLADESYAAWLPHVIEQATRTL
jgi:8-oxo-dGTP pyrophosphatase MutT (NUDIX family)